DADLGWAESTACDVMSGAGADVEVRVRTSSVCQGCGRPMRSLVTIGGEPFSRVAFATNSNAMSTKPATVKKVRAGIARSCCNAPQHPKNIIALGSAGAALPLIKKSSVEFNAGNATRAPAGPLREQSCKGRS